MKKLFCQGHGSSMSIMDGTLDPAWRTDDCRKEYSRDLGTF